MRERDKPLHGDIQAPKSGDYSSEPFVDWDNPEDLDEDWEDAPEGYYDEVDGDDDSYIPGPDDPDYDLSEAAGYSNWEPSENHGLLPQWVIIAVSLILILSFVGVLLIRIS